MTNSKAWIVGIFLTAALTSCGGDDSGGNAGTGGSGTGGTGTSSGLPNACELFTLAETAPYGPMEQGSHVSNDMLDHCIYNGNLDGEITQISVSVFQEIGFQSAVETEETVRPDSTKTAADYGEESYVFVRDGGATVLVHAPPYGVGVSVRLMTGAETAARDIMTLVLSRL